MDSNTEEENSLIKETKDFIRLLGSPVFLCGIVIGGVLSCYATIFFLDRFHVSALKEVRTEYEIATSKLDSEISSKDEELKRQKWDYSKLNSDFESLNKSFSDINNKYKSAWEFHYSYCKEQVRQIKLAFSAYGEMKQIIQYETPQSPIEHTLYNVYLSADKCVNRFEK